MYRYTNILFFLNVWGKGSTQCPSCDFTTIMCSGFIVSHDLSITFKQFKKLKLTGISDVSKSGSPHLQHVLLPAWMFPNWCEPQDFHSKKRNDDGKNKGPCHIIIPLIKTNNYKFLISRQDRKAFNLNSSSFSLVFIWKHRQCCNWTSSPLYRKYGPANECTSVFWKIILNWELCRFQLG